MSYYCNKCRSPISVEVYCYSKDKYHLPLCLEHQRPAAPAKKKLLRRRMLRKRPSTPEAIKLGNALRKRGWNAELEKFDGFKHIDIAIVSAKVNIEVDGCHHNLNQRQALSDLKRTFHSFKKGYVTLRIPNSLVKDDASIEQTAEYLHKFLKESQDQLEAELEDEDDV